MPRSGMRCVNSGPRVPAGIVGDVGLVGSSLSTPSRISHGMPANGSPLPGLPGDPPTRAAHRRAARDGAAAPRHQSTSRISPTSASSAREPRHVGVDLGLDATPSDARARPRGLVAARPRSGRGSRRSAARWPAARRACPRRSTRPPSTTATRSARLMVDRRWAMISVVRSVISSLERVVDLLLDLHVDRRRRVVEHEDRRVHHERARDRDAAGADRRRA